MIGAKIGAIVLPFTATAHSGATLARSGVGTALSSRCLQQYDAQRNGFGTKLVFFWRCVFYIFKDDCMGIGRYVASVKICATTVDRFVKCGIISGWCYVCHVL